MKRVLCNAVLDDDGCGGFLVTVGGAGEHEGQIRKYWLNIKNEDEAAREGIRKFVEEMGGDQ